MSNSGGGAESLLLGVIVAYFAVVVGLVVGAKRGHSPDTLGIITFFLGPIVVFWALIENRIQCQRCGTRSAKGNSFCGWCGQQVAPSPYWNRQGGLPPGGASGGQ